MDGNAGSTERQEAGLDIVTVSISVWSDVICPWCFVGKAHLESAVRRIAEQSPEIELEVRWRAFEIDPHPSGPPTQRYAERLATKYHRSIEQAQEMIATTTEAIRDAGGHADFDKVIAASAFDAHRLIQWAGETDRSNVTVNAQHRLNDSLMRGYFGDGLDLSNDEEMLDVVATLGLDRAAAEDVLVSKRFADTVRDDERTAQQYGIQGVPFFVIGDYGLSGAQPSEALVELILKVQSTTRGNATELNKR